MFDQAMHTLRHNAASKERQLVWTRAVCRFATEGRTLDTMMKMLQTEEGAPEGNHSSFRMKSLLKKQKEIIFVVGGLEIDQDQRWNLVIKAVKYGSLEDEAQSSTMFATDNAYLYSAYLLKAVVYVAMSGTSASELPPPGLLASDGRYREETRPQ